MRNVELKTERLTLRPLCMEDLEAVYRYASDAENTRYMMFYPHESKAETEEFLRIAQQEWQKESPEYYEFAVLLEGAQIGGVTLYLFDGEPFHVTGTVGEFSWLLDRPYQGNGYAAEAIHALIGFAQEALQLHTFIAQCDHRNAPSIALAERLKMTLVEPNGTRTYPKSGETARELTYMLKL